MKHIDAQTKYIRDLLYPIIGETKAKTYFSYYGIFKDKFMIGLYRDGDFYLRASQLVLDEIKSIEGSRVLETDVKGVKVKKFYLIPEYILNQIELYPKWFNSIIQEMAENKRKLSMERKKLIRYLPNMNANIERMLKKQGIHSVEDLVFRGEINVIISLVKSGIDVNQLLLFKLHGAIHNKYAQLLTPVEKINLLKKANDAFRLAGIRKRYFTNIKLEL